jgi:FtsZ-interacting cell division protein ZipA
MKTIQLLIIAVAVVAMAFTGCKKSGVDTAPMEKSFATADAGTKSSSDKAVSAIKAGDYSSAMAELGKLGQQAKLTPEQQSAVKDTIEQVKKQLSETMDKAAKGADKAVDDLKKSLPK